MANYYVEILSNTGEVVNRMGPHSESMADKVEMGVLRNLNTDEYFTRVVEENA